MSRSSTIEPESPVQVKDIQITDIAEKDVPTGINAQPDILQTTLAEEAVYHEPAYEASSVIPQLPSEPVKRPVTADLEFEKPDVDLETGTQGTTLADSEKGIEKEKELADPNIVDFEEGDGYNPREWTPKKKMFVAS